MNVGELVQALDLALACMSHARMNNFEEFRTLKGLREDLAGASPGTFFYEDMTVEFKAS